jgi:hypothetical protein
VAKRMLIPNIIGSASWKILISGGSFSAMDADRQSLTYAVVGMKARLGSTTIEV